MQNQINKLCRLTGNAELASTYLYKEKKRVDFRFEKHRKNYGIN